MGLRLKVLLILTAMWAIISIGVFVYSKSVLTHEYARIEAKEVTSDLDRANKSLNNLFASLSAINADWSQWDDAYQFMRNKNPSFIESNMAFTTFENAKINLIMFFDTAGKLFYGLHYDLDAKKFLPISTSLLSQLRTEKNFTRLTDITTKNTGIINTQDGYLALSAAPMLTSKGTGPIRGTLVMGYYLNTRHLAKLSDMVKIQLQLFTLPTPKDNIPLNLAYDHLLNNAPNYYIARQNDQLINGYTLIRDINKNPIGMLRLEIPRTLYNEGIKTIHRYLGIVIGMGILFLVSIWYLLKIIVLDRVITVSQQVADISVDGKFSKRVRITGTDELKTLVAAINSLIVIIESTEEQLKQHIALRTQESERLSKANTSLSTEMHNQKQVEGKLREDEKVLRQMAYYDALTGLPNRLFFYDILQKSIAKASQDKSSFAILFLDADNFKTINDTHGHHVGDKFLQHSASLLKATIKSSDIAARLAGDEFIICLNNVSEKALIANTAIAILQSVSTPLLLDHAQIVTTFSIGIAIFPEDGTTIAALEKHADLAMYYAKKQDKNAYFFYNELTQHELTN